MKHEGESFLNEKYPDLQHSDEVKSAVRRQEIRTDEKVKNDKNEKVQAYLKRLEEIFDVEDPNKKERRVDILKDKLHELFVVRPENISESYFDHQKQIARDQGHGDIDITAEMRAQMAQTIAHDQAQSLDAWVDYLGSNDATYPTWLKYFAFRSITKLSEYDKQKKEFKKRSKGTTAMFPDINREALAYVLDALEKEYKSEDGEDTTDEQWEKLLKSANFGKLYAHAIEKITPATEEEKENIQGEWIKYEQNGDHMALCQSLQGHGTGWCTAGEGVAKAQLELGDFYVFYSKDKSGQNKIPRVAIRMQEGEIAEVRGIEADQNLEGCMTDIARTKTAELPGAEKYEKRVSDMKRLTEIAKKFIDTRKIKKEIADIEAGNGNYGYDYMSADKRYAELKSELEDSNFVNEQVELAQEELRFLYEIDNQIEGFGYQKDPRIKELKNQRQPKNDYAKIFDCQLEEIALSENELSANTLVLVGNLNSWRIEILLERLKYIFGNLHLDSETDGVNAPNLTHIYGDLVCIDDFCGELPEKLKYVGRDFFTPTGINKLPEGLEYVGRDLSIEHSRISELPKELIYVGGNLEIKGSDIRKLPKNISDIVKGEIIIE